MCIKQLFGSRSARYRVIGMSVTVTLMIIAAIGNSSGARGFSLKDLRGTFVNSVEGFAIDPVSGPIPIRGEGLTVFDKSGQFDNRTTVSFGGQVFELAFRGTTILNPDGRGSFTYDNFFIDPLTGAEFLIAHHSGDRIVMVSKDEIHFIGAVFTLADGSPNPVTFVTGGVARRQQKPMD